MMTVRRSESSSARRAHEPPTPSSAPAGAGGARPAGSDGPQDFGATLRAARERKGVSLRQIAEATKISVAVLEGLERNDISRLPAGIFGRAFVRSFAAEVGLDTEAVVQQFTTQFRAELQVDGSPAPASSEGRRQRVALAIAALLVGALIAMGVIYAARRRAPAPPAPAGAAASSANLAPPARAPAPLGGSGDVVTVRLDADHFPESIAER